MKSNYKFKIQLKFIKNSIINNGVHLNNKNLIKLNKIFNYNH